MRILLFTIISLCAFTMDKPAYQLFDSSGEPLTYQALLSKAQKADIVLFGELHNNPINHWLQLQLTKDLYKAVGDKLVLGAEMFEADNQTIVDEYLKGHIKESNFTKEARVWNNYATDYRPLVEYAKAHQLAFVASNIPRRYASMVANKGFSSLEALSPTAKHWIVPLPIEVDLALSGYKNMLGMMQHGGSGMKPENFVYAQAIKDATMAHFILKNWQKGSTFLHFNGAYHSDDFQGIAWYLKQTKPKLRVLTISSVEQEKVQALQEKFINKADVIIVTPNDLTKTY
ncbi:MAG: ChaN family lipoprotein [Thermonemataceae bacterium]